MAIAHATPFAGLWYPERRDELEGLMDRLFDYSGRRTGPSLLPRPLAFVVPHAGLAYSGTVAASAYRHLQAAKPERVFLLGFCHRGGRPGVRIPDVAAFQTPLGEMQVDQAAAAEMTRGGSFVMTAEDRVCDHSVEIQLPLLQRSVPGARLVPLYVGTLNGAQRCAAARELARQVRAGDVILASSDLTHYGRAFGYEPFPADRDAGGRLRRLDSSVMDAAGSLDPEFFLETLRGLDSTVCGYEPIALLLETLGCMAGEDVFQERLDYQTSADLTGDFEHSVSYGSLGYFRADSFRLEAEAQDALLASARATLQHLCDSGERKPIAAADSIPAVKRRAAAFVTLRLGGELFGCVGTRTGRQPLAQTVPELTISAALDDPRFPVRARVPKGLDLEISVLTPMKRIRDWRSFRIGRDGACLEHEGRVELLLPQVANHGYTQTGFLEALCQKAGLRWDAYRDPEVKLSVFQAQVIA